MRIGVDIDGTLYPWTLSANKAVEEKFGIEGLTEHTHWDYLYDQLTPEQWKWVWSADAAEAVFGREESYDGCIEAVNQLCDEYDVHFVTHRNPLLTSEVTARWIAERFHNYAGIHVISNKVSKTSLGTWDVFIDDKPDTIVEFLDKTNTIMLVPSRPWNEHVEGGLRFTDWSAIVHTLKIPEGTHV